MGDDPSLPALLSALATLLVGVVAVLLFLAWRVRTRAGRLAIAGMLAILGPAGALICGVAGVAFTWAAAAALLLAALRAPPQEDADASEPHDPRRHRP